MFYFSSQLESDFEGEVVSSCFIAKVFELSRYRNAYYQAASQNAQSFTFSLTDAKQHVEKKRTQGSQWAISERPTLVFAGPTQALAVGEIFSARVSYKYSLPRIIDIRLDCLAAQFRPKKFQPNFRYVGPSNVLAPARFPFFNHYSHSNGARCDLRWTSNKSEFDLDPMLRIVSRLTHRMQRG